MIHNDTDTNDFNLWLNGLSILTFSVDPRRPCRPCPMDWVCEAAELRCKTSWSLSHCGMGTS